MYLYFAFELVGSQHVGMRDTPDLHFPVFSVFKLVLLMGWLKVMLIN